METHCVFFEVKREFLNIMYVASCFEGLILFCFLYAYTTAAIRNERFIEELWQWGYLSQVSSKVQQNSFR
jgi:hypothetical protein